MKKPIKAVMLPTDDITTIEFDEHNQLWYNPDKMTGADVELFQHLYITASQDVEPIKEGDWYILLNGGKYLNDLCRFKGQPIEVEHLNKYDCRKIIATTDPKLKTEKISYKIGTVIDRDPIPQVQQSFLKEYVANPNGEWEVEYEEVNPKAMWNNAWKLKLNQDSEVEITAVEKLPILVQQDMSCTLGVGEGDGKMYVHGNYKSIKHLQGKLFNMEKMYSRDEVDKLINDRRNHLNSELSTIVNVKLTKRINSLQQMRLEQRIKELDWIKENL
tara:strand:+ start:472 stop:1290 length:819 start_codon:yes stop_codon:yes gene_type:complete